MELKVVFSGGFLEGRVWVCGVGRAHTKELSNSHQIEIDTSRVVCEQPLRIVDSDNRVAWLACYSGSLRGREGSKGARHLKISDGGDINNEKPRLGIEDRGSTNIS